MSNEKISTVVDFVTEILALRDCWSPDDPCPEYWFRGVNDSGLALLPGAYWRGVYDETSVTLSFRAMVPSYLSSQPIDDWDWYYLMQHYGIPTRLLDWSENPLFALYFALATEASAAVPCVWMLDPGALNRKTCGADEECVLVPMSSDQDSPTKYWLPLRCGRGIPPHLFDIGSRFKDNHAPLAIYPRRNNPRLVAQRGVFTIHGSDETPIDQLLEDERARGSSEKGSIYRIPIDPSRGSV